MTRPPKKDKRVKLEAAIGAPLDHVRYIAMDVGRGSIKERLADNGYDADKKSLFILEGLVPYIPADALAGLLGFVASGGQHAVVFDYLPPSVVDGSCRWVEGRNMYREVLSHGQRFRLGFDHDELDRLLRDRGFDVVENVNAPDLKTGYFHGASAHRPVTPVFWFVHAVASGSR